MATKASHRFPPISVGLRDLVRPDVSAARDPGLAVTLGRRGLVRLMRFRVWGTISAVLSQVPVAGEPCRLAVTSCMYLGKAKPERRAPLVLAQTHSPRSGHTDDVDGID